MIRRVVGTAAVAGVAIFGGAGAFDDDTTRDASGEIVESGGLGVYAIQIGDCVQYPEETEISSVEAVPCSTPHDAQAFATTQAVYGGAYDETSDAFFDAIAETCLDPFESFVGTAYADSVLYFDYLYPGPAAWAEGTRDVTCMIVPADGQPKLVGDMEGSGL